MKCTWLLPVALAVPGVLAGQESQSAADCSLSRPLEAEASASALPLAPMGSRIPRLAEISRQNTPMFSHSSVWTPPAFARAQATQPARPRSNSLPRFLLRNPLLTRPLIRKLANQLAGRELFDPTSAGHSRIRISPHVDPGSEEYGVRVKLSLTRRD